jgi:hypothetical protein
MKKLITIGASVLLVNLSALAQGTILLSNIGPGLTTAGVKDPNGVLVAAGSSQYTIELLAGTSASTVAAFPTAVTTTTWVGNGWFGVGDAEKVLPGFAGGSLPFFQLRAWKNTGGVNSYAAALAAGAAYIPFPAAAWQLTGGGLGNPGANPPVPAGQLFGMPSGLQLVPVPEPSTIVLGVLGAAALLLRRRK